MTAQRSKALVWLKSSYSAGNGGECVEVARTVGVIHVRDSKDKGGPALAFGPDAWTAFVGFAARLEA
jgi:Domain of unknown function (DUF397).